MTHTPLPAVSSQWIQQLVVCLVHEKLVVCLVHEKLVVCLVHEKLVIHTVMMKIPVKNVQADRRQIINPPRAVEKQSMDLTSVSAVTLGCLFQVYFIVRKLTK